MAHFIDLVVDGRVFFDVGVGRGDIRLRLVVIVVGDEVFDRIVREHLLELGAELSREGLVVRQNERRTVRLGDDVRHREGLAGARDAL